MSVPQRVVKFIYKWNFADKGYYPGWYWYREGTDPPSGKVTTFLGSTCLYKDGGCHPNRYTIKLPEVVPVDYHIIAACLARDSANPGIDCSITGFCIHDGNGNGYEYAISEHLQTLYFFRETGWYRYDEKRKKGYWRDAYDKWFILVAYKKGDETWIKYLDEKGNIRLNLYFKYSYTFQTSYFTHLSLCGGRPYYIKWVCVCGSSNTISIDIVPRPHIS